MEKSINELQTTFTTLIAVTEESERNLYTAAEQTENRAAKLLLKAYAQQRAHFSQQLRAVTTELDHEPSALATADGSGFLQRGWSELRAALTVRRQNRQRLLLRDLLPHEEATINTFAQAEAAGLPAGMQTVVHQQHEMLRKTYRRLELLAGETEQKLVLRLFNEADAADEAVTHLEQNGIAADDIAVTDMSDIPVDTDDLQARPHATREAIITGVLLGALSGALLGIIYGLFHITMFPQLNGLIASQPVGIVLEIMIYGALIAAFFSLIFSALISRNAAESDAFLYQDSFRQGDRLVAVFAKPKDVSKIERIIGLQHEHEIEPVPA